MTKPKKRAAPFQYGKRKQQVNLSLTSEAIEGLDHLASAMGTTRSELVERIGRGNLQFSLQALVGESLTA